MRTGYSVVACKYLHGHRFLTVRTGYSVVVCKALHKLGFLGLLMDYSLVVCKALHGCRVLGVLTNDSVVACKALHGIFFSGVPLIHADGCVPARRPNACFQRRRWRPSQTGTSGGVPSRLKIAPSSGAAPAASAARNVGPLGT